MRLKSKVLEIPGGNIFENDKLKRKESIKNLSLLLRNVSSPLVLSVNAPWGAGKTTYLKMLHEDLKTNDGKSIYFSAWETDFAVDPLLAFLGEMNFAISSYYSGDSKKNRAWKKAKEAGAHILRRGIPVGVKLATAGLIDAEKLIEDEAGKFTEALSKDVISSYSKNKEAITVFKKSVKEVLKNSEGDTEKLFIFVDELDRCRPTYAIELLERIKHLLDIEGLVFILALDKSQLAHSVNAVYGSEFDAAGYLKRFIDIEFSLPSAELDTYINHLFVSFDLDAYFAGRKGRDTAFDKENLIRVLNIVCGGMSLRSIEQLLTRIKLVSLTVPNNNYFYPEYTVFLLRVKDLYPAVYSNFCRKDFDGEEMLGVISKVLHGGEDIIWAKQYIQALIISSKMQGARPWVDQKINDLKAAAGSELANESVRRNASGILEFISDANRMGNSVSLVSIINRIEMLSDFKFE
ncbi:KAP family P-loop NTPase fold protein [Pseudomonas sp. EA_15y_Pfl2_R67]|uniref:KAP family P-loop NTPase fold protein n=1 Tax=Pseudomonas sp. EA_15y_Pfl2_R67 TaxID=3088687 RepID=UPI0030DD09B9